MNCSDTPSERKKSAVRRKSIVFTGINTAELLTEEFSAEPGAGEVLVRTLFGGISPGTERANITGDPNVRGENEPDVSFPTATIFDWRNIE